MAVVSDDDDDDSNQLIIVWQRKDRDLFYDS